MAQHDMDVANGSGSAVRSDINSALSALVSNSSGASAPATTFAYQWWADTTNGILKQRNGGNSAWAPRLSLSDDLVQSKSSNYTVLASDFARLLACSGSITISLSAAASMGDGWWLSLRNAGTGIVTIDPNGSETIDGATTLRMFPGEAFLVVSDGANWSTVGRATGRVLIATRAANTTPYFEFLSCLSSDISSYELELEKGTTSSASSNDCVVQGSVDNGSAWLTNTYRIGYMEINADVFGSQTLTAGGSPNMGGYFLGVATSSAKVSGVIRINTADGQASWQSYSGIAGGSWNRSIVGSGHRDGTLNALRIFTGSGSVNWTSGNAYLYGIRK